MQVSFIGLGRLGLPTAVAIALKGHTVYGYDINQQAISNYKRGICHLYEPNIEEQLREALPRLKFMSSIKEAVSSGDDIIFIAVQTPHPPELDGSVRFNHIRKDFDYSYLIEAARQVSSVISDGQLIAVISTVLPGTTRNVIYPAMKEVAPNCIWSLCYNPAFIAMGQTIKDFYNPEFTLIGGDSEEAMGKLEDFYNTIHSAPKVKMTWEEAESVKVLYNTFIGLKIGFSSVVERFCHQCGARADIVLGTLRQATKRIASGAYLYRTIGDGGPCHPRDNLALSYFSDKFGFDYNLFDYIMTIRERNLEWLAGLICQNNLPKVIMGRTYKVNTNLTDGSPTVLLYHILQEKGIEAQFYDPQTDPIAPDIPACFIIGTPWPEFKAFPFPVGSVVIDPWGLLEQVPDGVRLISIGGTKCPDYSLHP